MPIKIMASVTVRVTCKCGNVIPIPIKNWDRRDPVVEEKSDNAMGNGIEHGFEISDYPCPVCGANVDAEFSVYEYPNGMKETHSASENVCESDIDSAISITL